MTQYWYDAMVRACWQGGALVVGMWALFSLWRGCGAQVRTWVWMVCGAKFLLVLFFVVELPVLAPRALESPSGGAETSILYSYGAPVATSFDWVSFGFGLWALGVCAVVARAIADHRRLRRLVDELFEADARTREAWSEVGLVRVGVRVHPDATVPMVVGLFRPVVLLPEGLPLCLSDEELRMVLAHEAAHIHRLDAIGSLHMFVCLALFYFHPAIWIARREWQLDREVACDAVAMSKTRTGAQEYAAMLIKVSVGAGRTPVLALSAVPTFRNLQRRIKDMKNNKDNRRGRVLWSLLILCAAAAALPVALVQRQPKFGSGVFEGSEPKVKVTQQRKGGPISESVAAPYGDTAIATTGAPVATTYRTKPEGIPLAPAQVSGGPEAVGAPTSGAVVTGQAPVARRLGSEEIDRGGVDYVAAAGPSGAVRVGGGPTTAVVSRGQGLGSVSSAPGQASGVATTTGPRVAAPGGSATRDVRPTMGSSTAPSASSVTVVVRDKGEGGTGLRKRVTLACENLDVTAFMRLLSSSSGVPIRVRGLTSSMRLNATVENAEFGEVMGTLARIYSFDWRMEDDGSITVSPARS